VCYLSRMRKRQKTSKERVREQVRERVRRYRERGSGEDVVSSGVRPD